MSKSTLAVQATANPHDVRAWAVANGHPVGTRGRIHPDTIKAYNKTHAVKYVEAGFVKTSERVVKVGGRKRTRKVSEAQARVILAAAGVKFGRRGPLSAALVQQAYDLSK